MALPKDKRENRGDRPDAKVNLKQKGKKGLALKKSNFGEAYSSAAYILNRAYAKKGQVKTLVYQSKYNNKRHLLYLVVNILKNKAIIDRVIEAAQVTPKIKNLPYAEVITFELLFGRGKVHPLTKENRPFQENKAKLIEALKVIRASDPSFDQTGIEVVKTQAFLPKYARVNTLLTTVEEVLALLRIEKIGQVKYERNEISFEEFLVKVQDIRKNSFIVDYHFSDLLVFHSNQPLFTSNVYKQGFISISDKASCFPVKMLMPQAGSVMVDSCAAPGMKTCHLATVIGNKGKILASDRNAKRVETLKKILGFSGVTCCVVSCLDFLEVNPFEEPYKSAEFALVDPSCTSSGMVGRLTEYLPEDKMTPEKLRGLTRFQTAALVHAMTFPNMKRVAYSTCSINVEENEKVVQAALNHFPNQYEVADTFPEWPERGDENFKFGNKCVRAFPKKHLTNGFFVAILERDEDVPLKKIIPDDGKNFQSLKGKKNKKMVKEIEFVEEGVDEDSDEDLKNQTETPKKSTKIEDENEESSVSSNEIEDIIISKKKSGIGKVSQKPELKAIKKKKDLVSKKKKKSSV